MTHGERNKMTTEQKIEWLANAPAEELLRQLQHLVAAEALHCTYGEGQKDIDLTKAEILKRMSKSENKEVWAN